MILYIVFAIPVLYLSLVLLVPAIEAIRDWRRRRATRRLHATGAATYRSPQERERLGLPPPRNTHMDKTAESEH